MNYNKLKGKRNEACLTQEELAKRIGITPISYNRKENGKRQFTCLEAEKIATELGLTLKEIGEIFFSKILT